MVTVSSSIRERRVLVDSAAYLALIDRRDDNHRAAQAILSQVAEQRFRQYTTNVVVIESHALILSAMGISVATSFLHGIEASNTVVVRCRASDETRAKQIIFQYDDKDFSFTDALSFAVMERLGIQRAFTFDRHFAQFGWTVLA